METVEMLIALLRFELTGDPVDEKILERIDEATLDSLFSISDSHDISHLVASALCNLSKLGSDDSSMNFRKKTMEAVYRYEMLKKTLQDTCVVLESAAIPFVPLKGAIIRDYYHEPWKRTSCDIDLLVERKNVERAVFALKNELNYSGGEKSEYHDVSLYSQSGVHLELHFSIKENNSNFDTVLSKAWEYALPSNENSCCFKFQDEFFVFYFVAHAAYHFLDGGCGIRTLVDLFFIEKALQYNEEKLVCLLEEAKLLKFYENLKKLSSIWFAADSHTSLTRQMEEYIIQGQVYGILENHIAVQQNKAGGKIKYALKKIFIPYENMKKMYPFLERHMWLMPFMQVLRWFRIVFEGRAGGSMKKLSVNNVIAEERVNEVKSLVDALELNDSGIKTEM